MFRKFDEHFEVNKFRALKRKEFLQCVRQEGQAVMEFIAEIKLKAEFCEYGDMKDRMIVDMIINNVDDSQITARLIELSDQELTLPHVTSVCSKIEVTMKHVATLSTSQTDPEVLRTKEIQSLQQRGYHGKMPLCHRCYH